MKETVLFDCYVTDDGMTPRVIEGDRVFYSKRSPEDGKGVVASINGEKAIVRTYRALKKGFMLIPTNPRFEPMIFNNDDLENGNCEIFGVVERVVAYY